MQLQLQVNTNQLFYRVVFPAAIIGLLVAMVLLLNALFHQQPIRAETGVLNLQHWSFADQPAKLAGEWAFYWNQYLPVQQITDQEVQQAPAYLTLPGVWNGMDYQGRPLPLTGHGTLVLKVKVPQDSDYLLKVPILTNRYRLWVNGEQQVFDDLEQPWAHHNETTHSRLFSFSPVNGELLLVFHLSNQRHRAGGIWEPISLTQQAYQSDLVKWPKLFDALAAFVLSCAAVAILVLDFGKVVGPICTWRCLQH